MKKYTKQEFLKLPGGVLFRSNDNGYICPLMTKWWTCTHPGSEVSPDFFEAEFAEILWTSPGQEEVDLSEVGFDNVSREALFDDKIEYLVFSKSEIDEMIARLQEARKHAPE